VRGRPYDEMFMRTTRGPMRVDVVCEALREAFAELPDPDWLRNPPA
jgi:hypothetical protein